MCNNSYEACRLCARECGVNRAEGEIGFCRVDSNIRLARAALHHWEEPVISGTRGSGTVFFSGCSLGCVFCQNREISRGGVGKIVSVERLSDIMLELQDKGAHNINFVTPTHYAPSIREAVILSRSHGLSIPTVYNTGGYDNVETIEMLSDVIDVFLPDMKYFRDKSAAEYSFAQNYPEVSRLALSSMMALRPTPIIDSDGIMRRGVIVRILLLPSHLAEAKLILKYVFSTYGDSVYISLMNQYTPPKGMNGALSRRVTHAEYDELVSYAIRLGVKNAFIQEWGTADESFIPPFDLEGV